MCAITGWSLHPGNDLDPAIIERMADKLAHRGPDDRGQVVDLANGIALSHRRLSIIDLSSAGHQPMESDDGSFVLAFNGELYNYRELRRELSSLGRRFRSQSDTEVVANALAQWGREALRKFSGMFALAAWDKRKEVLLLARDPLGMKPLYFMRDVPGGGFAFASELKAFLAMPGFIPRINPVSLRQFLEFGYVFDETDTILRGVSKMPPGHAIEIAKGRPTSQEAYFSSETVSNGQARSLDENIESLHGALSDVVRQHLVADVPVGLLLSGGLDSSVIAALASRETRVTTVSMGFAGSRIDERPDARAVASHIGSDHHEILIEAGEVIDDLENVVWYFDDLFADWGTISTRLLYLKCRQIGIKVVLVGEGSDELFGGYPVFAAAKAMRGPLPWRLFKLYRRYAARRYGSQFGAYAGIMRTYLARSGGDLFQSVRMFESRNQLPNNYVMKVDKASMSVSVEARAPFLDRRIAELAYAVPSDQLLAGGTDKYLLRALAERHSLLPAAISRRPKFGASIAASWMDESDLFRRYACARILSPNGWTDRLGLRNAMTDFFQRRRQGYAFPRAISIFSNLAWRLLLLDLWSKKYLIAP